MGRFSFWIPAIAWNDSNENGGDLITRGTDIWIGFRRRGTMKEKWPRRKSPEGQMKTGGEMNEEITEAGLPRVIYLFKLILVIMYISLIFQLVNNCLFF